MMKILFVVLALAVSQVAWGQVGCESTGDGPIDPQKSAVKRIDDSFRVSWAAPTQLADADCTPIASDPAFEITSYEVYVSLGGPVSGLPPVATVPASQRELTGSVGSVAGVRPGADIYFAVTACNEFGCSRLSEQKWVKVGGPPGKAETLNVE